MDNKPINIFSYNDFRLFLRDSYTHRKNYDHKFSHRFINTKIGVKSAGWFADVVSNRLGLKSQHIKQLANLFALKPSEYEYFRLLVDLDQNTSISEKTEILKQIFSYKGATTESIGAERFVFYENWYHSALRELLLLVNVEENSKELSRILQPPILPKQAKQSLLLMAKLGLISKNRLGYLKPTHINLIKDPTSSIVEWTMIQKSFLQLSIRAIEEYKKVERDFSNLTLTLSEDGLQKASEEIAGLRKRLLALSLQDNKRNRVYQCNFQVFPLSQKIKDKNV